LGLLRPRGRRQEEAGRQHDDDRETHLPGSRHRALRRVGSRP
jgi:hypothetical protein